MANTTQDPIGSTQTTIKLHIGATHASLDMKNHHSHTSHHHKMTVAVTISHNLPVRSPSQAITEIRPRSLRACTAAVPPATTCCNLTVQLAHLWLTLKEVGILPQYKTHITKQNVAAASNPLQNSLFRMQSQNLQGHNNA